MRYERVCFEKQYVRVLDRVGAPMASLLHSAHPLMQSVTDLVLEPHRNKLKQGAVLVDPSDMGLTSKVMFIIDHSVKEGADPSMWSHAACSSSRSTPKGTPLTLAGLRTWTWSRSPRPTWR